LQQLGAEVRISATDICDRSQLEALFASFNPAELAGIVHLAGALDAAPVSAMSNEVLRRVLAPKTAGTWLLHGMTESLPLDFFVLFSSWAAVVGAQNLAHYSAANQFLDAFAHYRRSKRLPALSVNWATWDAAGSLSDDALQEYARGGLQLMPSNLALAALGKAMASGDAQITIAAVDWAVLKTVYEARRTRPLLELVANSREEKMVRHSAGASFRNQLATAAEADRLGLMIAAVRERAAAVLRLRPDELPLEQGLFELGMDSLMAAELKTKLEVLCDLCVPATTIFRHSTVCALAEYLERELRPETQPTAQGNDDPSEDELAAMLATALQEIR
jgi:acyl carrier protein/nicotinamide mononucleotide (NMN) deamidase PncC